MKKISCVIFACAVVASFAHPTPVEAQTPAAPQTANDPGITARFVSGEVTELVPAENRMTIRTAAGAIVAVAFTPATQYKRLPPGETTRTNAKPILASDFGVGDRVIALGSVDTAARAAAAREVLVFTRADLDARVAREQGEWRRGVVGTITAINPATREITVQPRARAMMGSGQAPAVVVAANEGSVVFRRYATDSVRFQDAKLGKFDELKVGDQLRARGERAADGARFTPKEIVTGSFRTIAGTVTAVAPDAVTLVPVTGGAPLVVTIKSGSTLRRLPADFGAPGGVPGGARPGAPAAGGGGDANPNRGQAPGAAGGFGARAGVDFSEILERLPALTLAELKVGDVIAVSGTTGADATRLTAIAVLSGVEGLVAAAREQPQQGRRAGGNQSVSTGLPGGFDLGIGGP